MAYPPHADSDAARWQRELEHLRYLNGQLRVSLEEARMAVNKANDEAAAYRDEAADLKNKIEVFWDSIEGARAMFVRSFPNYNTYRDSHKRSREVDERERLSRKSQRLEAPPTAGPSSRDRERERRPRSHEFPPETGGYPPEHEYRSHPRGQPHLTVPVPGSDKHAYNGRSPYDAHPPGPYPDPAHPHVDPTRGHSASPHLATRIPSHQGHRHAPSDASAYAEHQTHSRRESDPTLIPRQRRPANAEQATTRSSPSPSAPQQLPGVIDTNPNRPALPPAGAIIIHPPAAFQVSFTDLQPGIFLDRSDFGVEYPPNLDPPQGLQAVRCLFCDKHYSGANARSLWRRHVMGKHDFTMKGQRASTVRNRHMAQPSITSVPGDLTESAPPSAVPAASPVNPQPPASSRPPEVRPPRAPSPGHKRRPEGEHPESEDDQEAFDYQRHHRKPEPGPNGTGSPLTHAALESWTKGSGANSGGDVARWQGQGSVPGKSQAPDPKGDEEQTIGSPDANPGDKREWCLCRRPDSRDKMIRCDVPTCAIQWYHARCVGMTLEQVKAMKEWICEDCNRKTAQRRQEAHRDAPPADKERTPHTPEPPKDADVVMREEPNRPVEEPADDPARGAGRRRRVVPESESPNDGKRDGEADEAEPSEPAKPEGTPRKKGRKGNALAPSGGSTPQSEVVTTPGGTRRTRSGKPFYLEDGASASDGERQRSMETN